MLLRNNKRLEMDMPNKESGQDENAISENNSSLDEASAGDSEDEKTIIEVDTVELLKAQIRNLQDSMEMLLKKADLQAPTGVVASQPPDGTPSYQLPHFTTTSTAAGAYNLPPPANITTASHRPMQQKISTDKLSLPHSFCPNLYSPHYSAIYTPSSSVQATYLPTSKSVQATYTHLPNFQPTYLPPTTSVHGTYFSPSSSVQDTYSPPSTSVQATYMPSSSLHSTYLRTSSFEQNTHKPPPLSFTRTTPNMTSCPQAQATHLPPPITQPYFPPTGQMTSTYLPINMTNASATTQHVCDHRPIRKLYDLPEFNGRPEQWPIFFTSYKETTQTYHYTNLENLSRLQKALRGDAKAKVEAFLIHPESVDGVMKTLEFHYGRPQIMIRSQISRVRAFPAISGRKMSEIINFSTMVANLTVFLENAGATPHLSNPTLLDELVNKLPFSKREEWVKYSLNNLAEYPTVREFSVWLHDIATYISLATEMEFDKNVANNDRGKIKSSFAITTEERRQLNCPMCQQNHYLNKCSEFKNISTTDRWKMVKQNHLCFACLHSGHSSSKCGNRRQCGLSKCMRYHNRLLHEDGNSNRNENVADRRRISDDGNVTTTATNGADSTAVTTIVDNSLSRRTLFKFLPVQLKGPKGCVNVIAFIDDGSKISLLEEKVAEQIGLQGPSSNLSLGWIGGKTSKEISKKINLEIYNMGEGKCGFPMRNVRTTGNLRLPPQTLQFSKFKERFPVLEDIVVDDYFDATPRLLIGLPHIGLVRPYNVVNVDENFSVHQTRLGNILFGSNEESTEATVCVINVHTFDEIERQISEYFTLESFGMKFTNPIESDDDKRAEEILKKTTVKNGLRYETGLLWRYDNSEFKESFSVALKRLRGVEAKMEKDADLAQWYKMKIEEYVSKCYARKLSSDEALMENDRTWYLPHFAITNINKNSKRRLVFDAAASVDGVSFNSRLMKGPSKYQPKPLLSILFRFRQCRIGVCADIREMFHRVKIREQDQSAQRFLWREGDSTRPPDVYTMQVMIFGSASSPCSAQYVKNLNAKTYENSYPRAYKAIVDCHYVDDYVDSFDHVDEAIAVTKDILSIHGQAGFELRSFVSNSTEFCRAIADEELVGQDSNLTDLCRSETMTEKILGLFWCPTDDTFCFVLKFVRVPEAVLNGDRKPTKSEVLSLTMSIFDPFGFLANMVIRSKMMLQELWRYDIDWNMPIPDEIYRKWFCWYKELQNVQYIKVPRYYGPTFRDAASTIDLHLFADASEVAFAAVGYWRICCKGEVDVAFVAGKSKCAPIKSLSIPRLELQAAVLAVRLKEAIISSHDIRPTEITFWSDSRTVVKWIQSDSRVYKQFVSHRIAEVLDYSEVKQWRWVPGSQNPADDATRPQYFSKDSSDSRWLKGPSFLKCDVRSWPELPCDLGKYDCESEIRSKYLILTITNSGSLIPYNEKSRYYRLLRIRCWLVRAVKIFRCLGLHHRKSVLNFREYLTAQEIREAENFWCQIAQQEDFVEEYNLLKLDKPVPKRSPIYKLSPFLGDDGLIRISGRINNAECVSRGTKEPVIMPKSHIITKLIVKQYHEDFKHQNQESICAAIRTKFWIPSLRQLVRSIKNNCQECKNRNAMPKPPLMGQLPIDRLSPYLRPFTYTGVDYLGPFMVSIGRRSEKRWVALFTCMTMRAIHVELAKDLSTDAVILCIRNFINRRGLPTRIRSDRGTNFVGASKEMFVLDGTRLADECTRHGIDWEFNTPANPSAGGAWERMVRCVKNVLAFTLKEKAPQVETLYSLLIEAENLVNSRPLTHLPIDNSDSEPLTPNHFLLGSPNIIQTPAVNEKVCLRKQWQILQQLKQTFWRRWVLEYLPDLTRRTKWYQPVEPLKVGDVVVICDDNEARGEWKRGIVEEVFMAADGQVRSAVVRTSVGRLRRPASKLAVLDVGGESP